MFIKSFQYYDWNNNDNNHNLPDLINREGYHQRVRGAGMINQDFCTSGTQHPQPKWHQSSGCD